MEDVGDLWAMERASVYRGLYHIVGGTLSALDGRGPEDLYIDRLLRRASTEGVQEVTCTVSNRRWANNSILYWESYFR